VSATLAIGVVSDTHLPRFGTRLPRALVEGLRAARVARIFHCGDHTDALACELLARIAPVDAVAGNNDRPALAAIWGYRRTIAVEGIRIGLVHGHEGRGRDAAERALNAFAAAPVDVVCFGHSHRPLIERRGGVLLVNPGSPTDKRREPRYSFALLTVRDRAADAELQFFDDRSP